MNRKLITLLSTIIMGAASASATNYWFTRGVEGASASRNWSDLNNWSLSNTSGNGWNVNKTSVQPGASVSNYDFIYYGVNSGYNGTDTGVYDINLDMNAYISKMFIGNAANIPSGISSANASKLYIASETLPRTGTSAQHPIIIQNDSGKNFTFNTDVSIESAAETITTNGNTTYSNLWSRVFNNSGTITFAEGTTLTMTANPDTKFVGELRIYNGKSSSEETRNTVVLNAKLNINQMVFGSANGSGNYYGKVIIGGSQSNTTGTVIVEGTTDVYLAKTDGAIAISGSRLQILSGSVTFMADNQMATTTQLAFAQSDAGATPPQPKFNLNGFSQQVKNIRMEAASWITKGVTLLPKIDFGVNSEEQTLLFAGFEFGKMVSRADAPTTAGLIIADSYLLIQNYTIGKDHIISSVKLSDKLLSTTISDVEGKTWMDMLVFDGYDMSEYELIEMANGANWEYSLMLIPEPSAYAAILGLLAIGFIIRKRRK